EVVLVGAVGLALAVGVVLVQRYLGDPVGRGEDPHGAPGDLLAGAVGDHGLACAQHLGGGVLGVGVVDVPAGAVAQHGVADRALRGPGEDLRVVPLGSDLGTCQRRVLVDARDVRIAHLVGELGGVGGGALQLEAARVPQRGLVAVVPADSASALPLERVEQRIGADDEVGEQDRGAGAGAGALLDVRVDHAELGLDAHDPLGGQAARRRCCARGLLGCAQACASSAVPSRSAAPSCPPSAPPRVRPWSGTIASTRRRPPPGRPETRAQSSGCAAEGMSSFSTNSAVIASRRCWAPTPISPVASWSFTASFFARSTMLRSVAPETKSRKCSTSWPPSEYSTRTKAEAGESS